MISDQGTIRAKGISKSMSFSRGERESEKGSSRNIGEGNQGL